MSTLPNTFFGGTMEEEANSVTIYKPDKPDVVTSKSEETENSASKKAPSTRTRKTAVTPTEISPQEARILVANLKDEQRKRADAEKALRLSQTDLEKTRKIAFTAQKNAGIEISNAKKAAEAEVARLKVEFNRDRANTFKLQGDSRKEVTVLMDKLNRTEKSLAEKTSTAAERSRQIASLRMELSREKVKNAKITSGDYGSVPTSQFSLQPVGGHSLASQQSGKQSVGELGQAVFQIQQMLAELLMRIRGLPMPYAPPPAPYPPPAAAYQPPYPPPPPYPPAPYPPPQQFAPPAPYAPPPPAPPPSYSPIDPYSLSGMKSQQDAMAAQISSIQMQQQEQFAEIARQQQATEERIVRRQREALEELANKQRKVMGDIERLESSDDTTVQKEKPSVEEQKGKLAAEEEYAQRIAEDSHNPSVDELADSLNSAIESRGGVVPTVSLSDFLKARDNADLETRSEEPEFGRTSAPPIQEENRFEEEVEEDPVEVYEKKKVGKDPLDDLIENLSRELTGLRTQLTRLNKINEGG